MTGESTGRTGTGGGANRTDEADRPGVHGTPGRDAADATGLAEVPDWAETPDAGAGAGLGTGRADGTHPAETADGGAAGAGRVVPRPVSGDGELAAAPAGAAAAGGRSPVRTVPAPARVRPAAAPPRAAIRRRRRVAAPLVAADLVGTASAALACAGAGTGPLLLAPACAGVLVLCARAGLYRPGLDPHALEELPLLAARVAVAWCVAIAVLAAFGRSGAFGPAALPAGVAGNAALACALRALVHGVRRRRGRISPRSALVVGRGETARTVTAVLAERPRYGLRPVGMVAPGPPGGLPDAASHGAPDAVRDGLPTGGGPFPESSADASVEASGGGLGGAALPVVATLEEVARAVSRNAVQDAVFVRAPWEDPHSAALAGLLGERGVTGWLVRPGCALGEHGTHTPGGLPPSAPTAHVWGFSCRRLALDCPRPRTGWTKRLLDVALVTPALVAAAPVLAGCALAVRLLDGPGVLFRQERIGQGGRPFTLLKFRTVRPANAAESATRWTVADDSRMSRVGRLLRRTSLDELPQLWNVLRGDMSLVGPRPERPFFVRQFSQLHAGYAERHRAPVGITGLAQVYGLRGDTSIEDRARFDNHYIETWSLWQDVRIMCRTATSFFRLEGR